jgi:hypothetical protein
LLSLPYRPSQSTTDLLLSFKSRLIPLTQVLKSKKLMLPSRKLKVTNKKLKVKPKRPPPNRRKLS